MASSLSRKIKNMARFRQILSVFFRHGFEFYIQYLNLGDKVPFYKKLVPPDDKSQETRPQRMRESFEELGGAFIKLGQLLSLRPDWVPPEYCAEFAKLQDSAQPFSSEIAVKTVEQELGLSIKKAFRSFNKKPIAAGSIAQVHRAVLRTGEHVVVKIKRPNIDEIVHQDIDILLYVAQLIATRLPNEMIDPVKIVNEFRHYAEAELDFGIEARSIELFHEDFSKDPSVEVPRVFSKFTTGKMIVMEFLDGMALKDFAKSKATPAARKLVLHRIVDSTFHQIFQIGHFHADPHPGNILILDKKVVGLLDFGLIGHLTDSMKERVVLFFISVIEADVDGLVDALIDIGAAKEEINREAFKQDLILRLGQFYDQTLKDLNVQKLGAAVLGISRDYKLQLPSNVVMLMKTIVTIESIGEMLDPSFNLVDFAKPSIKKMVAAEFSIDGLQKNFIKRARRFKRSMMVLPEQMYKFLSKLNQGDFKVEFEHKDLENLIFEIEKTSNKLVFGVLCAASLVGGAIAMNFATGIILYGLPVFAFAGFCLSGFFGLLLVFEILRR